MTEEGLQVFLTPMARMVFWLCLCLVVLLTLWPAPSWPQPPAVWGDKVEHILAWAVLGVLWRFGHLRSLRPAFRKALFVLMGLSAVLEVLQGLPFIGRTTSFLDLVANGAGLLLAYGLGLWLDKGQGHD